MKLFNLFNKPADNLMAYEKESLNRKVRMEEKRLKAIEELGEKYLLHPKHKVSKLEKPREY